VRIFDCTMYLNEIDLLELRMGYLFDLVDVFVIVEASKTLAGEDREVRLTRDITRRLREEWIEKISYIVVNNFPPASTLGKHGAYYHMKEATMSGLCDAQDNDIIMISDIDEIPHRDAVRTAHMMHLPIALPVRRFFFWLNTPLVKAPQPLIEPRNKVTTMGLLKQDEPEAISKLRRQDYTQIETAAVPHGWHFAQLGSAEHIREKMLASDHTEFHEPEFTDVKVLNSHRENLTLPYGGEYQLGVEELDSSYPRYLLDHQLRFHHLIRRK
jgi:beta-1,4-mannosyl-glycoprotein beta-1,4-N-acetylglucosaminyltransferase